jgi:hypothetical protein
VRILIVDAYYPRFLAHALERIPVDGRSYEEVLGQLLRLRFGTADFYSRHLRALGHEADDIVFNCDPLQRRWADEHRVGMLGVRLPARLAGLPFVPRWLAERDPRLAIAVEQVRAAAPDVLYLQDLNLFPPKVLRSLRRFARLIVGQIASPLPAHEYVQAFDLILTSFPHYVDRFRQMGIASEYFRIGFDPIVLDELGPVEQFRPCTFVGGLSAAHGDRTDFLERIARETELEVFGYGADSLASASPIAPRHRGEVWAMDMYRVLAESRITINVHIDVAEQFANNMRLYEATGCGALLITDHKSNLHELFAPGEEIVSYRSPEEAVEQIRYYTQHEARARDIAQAGQARTLAAHTYRVRMEELAAILNRYLRRTHEHH